MAEKRTYNYECMFLISQGVAADFKAAIDHLRGIVEKHGGSIIAYATHVAHAKPSERLEAFGRAEDETGANTLPCASLHSMESHICFDDETRGGTSGVGDM